MSVVIIDHSAEMRVIRHFRLWPQLSPDGVYLFERGASNNGPITRHPYLRLSKLSLLYSYIEGIFQHLFDSRNVFLVSAFKKIAHDRFKLFPF